MPRAREAASPELDPEALERAAALLNGAARPMIFVGGGAQDASAQVRALAERLGAPVVAGWMGQGVMDGRSPLSLSLTMAHRLWPEVDVALALGSRFQRVQTDWGLDDAVKVDAHRPRPDRDHPPRAPRGGAARGRSRGPGRALAAGPAPSTDPPGAGASPR